MSQQARSGSHTHVVFHSQLQDLFKRVNGVLAAYWVSLVVADMIVGGQHDFDGVFRA